MFRRNSNPSKLAVLADRQLQSPDHLNVWLSRDKSYERSCRFDCSLSRHYNFLLLVVLFVKFGTLSEIVLEGDRLRDNSCYRLHSSDCAA